MGSVQEIGPVQRCHLLETMDDELRKSYRHLGKAMCAAGDLEELPGSTEGEEHLLDAFRLLGFALIGLMGLVENRRSAMDPQGED